MSLIFGRLLFALSLFVLLLARLAGATGSKGAAAKYAVEVLRIHLQEITKVINAKEAPCGDFPNYTCGSYKNVTALEYPNERVHYSDIMKDIASKEIKLQSANKAKEFYNSCLQFKKPSDLLKKVDMLKRSNFDLAKSIGELKTAGIDFVLKTNINIVDDKTYKVIIGVHPDTFTSGDFTKEKLHKGLELLSIARKDINIVEENLNAFVTQGKSIISESRATPPNVLTDTSLLKNFEWSAFLGELKKLPKMSKRTQLVEIEDSDVLQKIFDLMAGMDKKLLKYLTALKIMKELSDADCDVTVEYFKLPILAEFYNQYFTQTDKDYYLKVLNEFLKSYEKIKSKDPSIRDGVYTNTLEKKKVLEDINKILDAKKVNNAYKDLKIEKDNYYQNFIDLLKWKLFNYLSKNDLKEASGQQYLMSLLNPVNRRKPIFYHFATEGLYLWELFFRENIPQYSSTKLQACIENQYKKYKLAPFDDYDYYDYVWRFAAVQQSFKDFESSWSRHFKSDQALENEFKKVNLTPEKAFFLNIAQRECIRIDRGKNIALRVLLNSEEVSNVFQCPQSSLLNPPEKCTF